VEDYRVDIIANAWQNQSTPQDVNGDGFVSPIDALLIINELNLRGARALEYPRPGGASAPFYDVNGDGQISPVDSAAVISYLNDPPAGSGEGESSNIESTSASMTSTPAAANDGNASSSLFAAPLWVASDSRSLEIDDAEGEAPSANDGEQKTGAASWSPMYLADSNPSLTSSGAAHDGLDDDDDLLGLLADDVENALAGGAGDDFFAYLGRA
jgi:hypothetical protein